MCDVVTYEQLDQEAWRQLVRESRTGTWFQTPEAYEFLASMPELFQPFVVGVASLQLPPKGKSDEVHPSFQGRTEDRLMLKGVCVGYVTKERNPIKQLFTRRAIILGGPVFANDATDEEVTTLMRAVRNLSSLQGRGGKRLLSPIYIETRNFNDYSTWKEAFEAAEFEYKAHLNFHVDCTDREKIWERLSENRKRQIKRAQANCVTIEEAQSESEIQEWYRILHQLYQTKVKTPLWPMSFFRSAYRQGVGKFLLVKHNGNVIGGSFCVELKRDREKSPMSNLQSPISNLQSPITTNESVVYEWFECGLNGECKEQYPSVMATWAGLQRANEAGIQRYDMMGAGMPNVPYGVRDFKAEFGGEMVEHGRWLCVNKPLLYRIGSWGVKILKKQG